MNINNKLSVSYAAILTTFNSEDTLDDALVSIMNQDEKPTEIWVVDDCSTDSTRKKLDYWSKARTDIQVILNPTNKGQSYSRNIGVKNSKSELLIFFDDDDVSKSQRSVEHLRMHSVGADLSYVSSEKVYDNGYKTISHNRRLDRSLPTAAEMVRKLVIGRTEETNYIGWVPASTLAISKKSFDLLGGFDENLRRLEDSDLAIRAADNGLKFSWSDQNCVLRKSTSGLDKGGIIETNFELILLKKYRNFLNKKEFNDGERLIKIRGYYFSKRLMKLVIYVLIHPTIAVRYPLRVLRFFDRIIHDYRKTY